MKKLESFQSFYDELENAIKRVKENQSDCNYIRVTPEFCELNREKLKNLGIELINIVQKSEREYDVFLQVNPPIKHIQIDFKI